MNIKAGVDLVGLTGPSQRPNVSGPQAIGLQFAARELLDELVGDDPVSRAFGDAVRGMANGPSYAGSAHITLAGVLRDAGRCHAAWDSLAQVSFHAAASGKAEIGDEARCAALALAREQDWTTIATIVEALTAGSEQ